MWYIYGVCVLRMVDFPGGDPYSILYCQRSVVQYSRPAQPYSRPVQPTRTANPYSRPAQATRTADPHSRPAQPTRTTDPHSRPVQQTHTADPCSRPVQPTRTTVLYIWSLRLRGWFLFDVQFFFSILILYFTYSKLYVLRLSIFSWVGALSSSLDELNVWLAFITRFKKLNSRHLPRCTFAITRATSRQR